MPSKPRNKKHKTLGTIADLKPDDRNANRGTERGTGLIEKSLRSYGAGRSILADRNGKIIAGNKTLEGAASIGLDKVRIVETDGTELVVVQRTDLDLDTDKAARELAIVDNRAGQVSLEWDAAELTKTADEFGIDLMNIGFNPDEISALGGAFMPAGDGVTAPNLDPGEGRYSEQYGVIVICGDEGEQERAYEELKGRGYNCRVVVT